MGSPRACCAAAAGLTHFDPPQWVDPRVDRWVDYEVDQGADPEWVGWDWGVPLKMWVLSQLGGCESRGSLGGLWRVEWGLQESGLGLSLGGCVGVCPALITGTSLSGTYEGPRKADNGR